MIPFDLSDNLNHTWLFDLDGTILEHNNLVDNIPDKLLPGVKELWESISNDDYIILITARPESFKEKTLEFLNKNNIRYDKVIFGVPSGERILVNDIKPKEKLKTAIAWNVNRNKGF